MEKERSSGSRRRRNCQGKGIHNSFTEKTKEILTRKRQMKEHKGDRKGMIIPKKDGPFRRSNR